MPRRSKPKPEPRPERVPVELIGHDGNAFAILGRCRTAAITAGWQPDEIQRFLDEATEGNYDHLLGVVSDWFIVE